MSFDAYDKFIEDDFLGGQRLDPKTDGRPDPRPDVRENASILGDLVNDFNFTQTPLPPVVLAVHPNTTLTARPPFQPQNVTAHKKRAGRVKVTWRLPSSNGGSPILHYQVIPSLDGIAQPAHTFGPNARSGLITGLTVGAQYTFVVAAINNQGLGVLSIPTTAITA